MYVSDYLTSIRRDSKKSISLCLCVREWKAVDDNTGIAYCCTAESPKHWTFFSNNATRNSRRAQDNRSHRQTLEIDITSSDRRVHDRGD
jgi:hypothetical protein